MPTPLLERSDLAGTAFLLAAEGKDPAMAPNRLRLDNIDYARRAGVRRSKNGVRTMQYAGSLDREYQSARSSGGRTLAETIPGVARDPAVLAAERETMARVLAVLPLTERRILAALLRGDRAKTMIPRLGLSEGRVSQLLKMARARAAAILAGNG